MIFIGYRQLELAMLPNCFEFRHRSLQYLSNSCELDFVFLASLFFWNQLKLICNKTLQLLWMPAIYCELQITPNHVSLVNSFCKLECTVRHSCFVTATHDNSCKRVCLLASSLLAVQVPLNSCQLMLPLSTYANSYQLTLTLVNAFLHSSTCINFFHLMLPLSTHDKSSLANFRQILSGLLHYFDVY